MFKVLVRQRLHGLADDATGFQIADRKSFRAFLGLTPGDAVLGSFPPSPRENSHSVIWKNQCAANFEDTTLDEFFAGERREFSLTLAPVGTPFRMVVWHALRAIPYGETISYGELARRIGNPRAFRAVGLANGRNPLSVIVPCHRVIGADGTLTGYGGGLERKRFLLALESGAAVGG